MILDNAIAINQGVKDSYGSLDPASAYAQPSGPAMTQQRVRPAEGSYNTLSPNDRTNNKNQNQNQKPPPLVDYVAPKPAASARAQAGHYETVDGVSTVDGTYDVAVDNGGTYATVGPSATAGDQSEASYMDADAHACMSAASGDTGGGFATYMPMGPS